MWIALSIALLLIGIGIFVGTAYAAGVMNVKTRPREPMAWCSHHGHFRKAYMLKLGDIEYCPQCWLTSLKKAASFSTGVH